MRARVCRLLGPWISSEHSIIESGEDDEWDAMVTNPAPMFEEDGTAYMFYRGTQWPTKGEERIGPVTLFYQHFTQFHFVLGNSARSRYRPLCGASRVFASIFEVAGH